MRGWLLGFLTLFCSGASSVSLEMWSSLEEETTQQIVTSYNSRTSHQIDVRRFHVDSIRSELLIANQGMGATPDVLYIPSDLLGLNTFLSFSSLPASWLSLDLLEAKALDLITVDGQYYGVPIALGNHLVLYVNNELAQNLKPSWEDLFAMTHQQGSPISMQYPNMYFFMSFVSLFSPNDIKVATEAELAALSGALQFYIRLIEEQVLQDSCDQDCARSKFEDGKVAYLIDGDWALGELKQSMGSKLTISSLPNYQRRPMRSLSGGKVLAFSQHAMNHPQKRQALEELAQIAQESEFIYKVIIGQNLISSQYKLNEFSYYANATYYDQLYTELSPAIIMPSSVRMAVFWEAVNQGIKRYQLGMPAEASAAFILDHVDKHTSKIENSVEYLSNKEQP